MKKFWIGLILGFTLAIPVGAHADDIVQSLVGKEVQGEFDVKIDGKKLDKKAPVIDGTTYAPVRAIAESLGKDIAFDPKTGVEIKQKGGATVTPTLTKEQQIEKIKKQIADIKQNILADEAIESGARRILDNSPNASDDYKQSVSQRIEEMQREIQNFQSKITDLEAQLAQLQQQ